MLKFVSLLGTNAYWPCNYVLDNEKVENCCYIQEALIRLLTNKGLRFDSVLIFTTEAAYKKNWINNEYSSKNNEQRSGLEKALKEIFQHDPQCVKNIFIPCGNSEKELWQLFDIFMANIEDGDEIVLDITHSFRFLPMLTFIVLCFARIIKKCEIKGVYYGAFDVLGGLEKVKDVPVSERNAPVFDLTPFVVLFDWVIGVERYLKTGDASIINQLTGEESSKLSKRIREDISQSELPVDAATLFREPRLLRRLSDAMMQFSSAVFACRGQDLSIKALELKRAINEVVETKAYEHIKPLAQIMDLLKNRFDRFGQDEHVNMLEAVRWCLENNMYQQGLTILEEGLISFACDTYGLDKKDKEIREEINRYAHKIHNNTDVNLVKSLFIEKDFNATKEFYELLYDVCYIRNDINHAGWTKHPVKSSTFKEKLEEFLTKAEKLIYSSVSEKQMLLVFSHDLTESQKLQAREKLGITQFIPLSPVLLEKWSNIPPDLDKLDDYLADILNWIDDNARGGDYVLVQGDYGATMMVVSHCIKRNLKPVYATTHRVVKEEKRGDKVVSQREFEHVDFREYRLF
ncbi:TIGR02221 family CRISPR-associated protein [Caldicoprobacter algeriensis]|uniref:CRISPR-associated protein Csx20 n=1 Tax=Caldicoprobacter algeriensis TaxID=699281 RepID=UPI00207A3100|nr:CRISPR-associated protein Csx20 [Caldicoprobacter algeriensis]MCM8901258.1 TIGR02221 family CRISPR-associated protein [Caldicoprobacter algeriensis]